MIRLFGAPNGLCLSIIESKHIKAIKEPYRQSNHNQLQPTTWADEPTSIKTPSTSYEDDVHSLEPVDIDPTIVEAHVHIAHITYGPEAIYPQYDGKVCVFNSASDMFYAPSDEFICSTPLWQNKGPQLDYAFVNANLEMTPMNGLEVPNSNNGMWMVQPQLNPQYHRAISIIHVDSIYCTAHLIPVYEKTLFFPIFIHTIHTIYSFCLFYVNKFADHHTFEIAS
ncbi:hypothetical protein EV363DRAFT_1400566 [Boletus edulis]|nr:hypothetical protein EV363DRAFT_1400566 [Boletus edulis]